MKDGISKVKEWKKDGISKVKEWKTDEDPVEDRLNKGLIFGCVMAVAIFTAMKLIMEGV